MVYVRLLTRAEIGMAMALALRVFMRFEAPDYSPDGVETFRNTLAEEGFLDRITCYGAFEGNVLVGMLATRSDGLHITLFFVEEPYQRRGIGQMLFEQAQAQVTGLEMTVNSSPYAVQVYKRLGFKEVTKEQLMHGIRFTPMRLVPKK